MIFKTRDTALKAPDLSGFFLYIPIMYKECVEEAYFSAEIPAVFRFVNIAHTIMLPLTIPHMLSTSPSKSHQSLPRTNHTLSLFINLK